MKISKKLELSMKLTIETPVPSTSDSNFFNVVTDKKPKTAGPSISFQGLRMPTTNILRAKHLNGKPVTKADIRVGLKVEAPSQTGGVLEYVCKTLSDDTASFESTDPEWPVGFKMKFDAPDLTMPEFIHLSVAINTFAYNCSTVTDKQRALVLRAHELGYVNQVSYTQVSWSDPGIARFKELKDQTRTLVPMEVAKSLENLGWTVAKNDPCIFAVFPVETFKGIQNAYIRTPTFDENGLCAIKAAFISKEEDVVARTLYLSATCNIEENVGSFIALVEQDIENAYSVRVMTKNSAGLN